MQILRGNNVYLRRLAREDLSNTIEWINDEKIMVIMGVRGPRNQEIQEKWFDNLNQQKKNMVFAICLEDSNLHIGNVSLFDINFIDSNAGLTIFIGDEEQRGKGYGSESLELLLRYAFDYLNLHKVHCKTNSNNYAAELYKKLGFKQEGVLREQSYEFGEYVDKIRFGILSEEFDRSEDYDKIGG
jgi:RimJ/RimL family protein N-acetyltransferase